MPSAEYAILNHPGRKWNSGEQLQGSHHRCFIVFDSFKAVPS